MEAHKEHGRNSSSFKAWMRGRVLEEGSGRGGGGNLHIL